MKRRHIKIAGRSGWLGSISLSSRAAVWVAHPDDCLVED